jgi:hypothetical protein
MADPLTAVQATARFNISYSRLLDLCRAGELRSAHKAQGMHGGQACWQIDPDELKRFLGQRGPAYNAGSVPEPWSPRYRPAPPGEPTELQYAVLAGESWHDLLDMQMRDDGSLWTKWSDGERFIIRPDGELDKFTYVWVGARYRERERMETQALSA